MQNLHFKLVDSVAVDLNPTIVQQFATMPASPTERELSEKRKKHLKDKVEGGLAMPFNWAKAQFDGKEYRVNGQHSSAMLYEFGQNLPDGLKAHISTFEVSSHEELALLFRQFDDRNSGRTAGDVAGAYQGLETALSGVKRVIARISAEGLAWHNNEVLGNPKIVGDDRYALLHDANYHPFVNWADSVISHRHYDEMKKASVLAAMYESFANFPREAQSFWKEVAKHVVLNGESGLDEDHPAARLGTWLVDAADKDKKHFKPSPTDNYQAGVYCFNAYNSNRDLRSVNISRIKDKLRAH